MSIKRGQGRGHEQVELELTPAPDGPLTGYWARSQGGLLLLRAFPRPCGASWEDLADSNLVSVLVQNVHIYYDNYRSYEDTKLRGRKQPAHGTQMASEKTRR